MFDTPKGKRILSDAEKTMYLHGLAYVLTEYTLGETGLDCAIEQIDSVHGQDDPLESAPKCFASLHPRLKIMVLAIASRSLIEDAAPIPDRRAWLEAAIYTVFEWLKDAVDEDIRVAKRCKETSKLCTNIIAPAVTACLDDQNVPAAYDRKAWHFCIDGMRNLILWDEDFDINQHSDPEVAAYVNDYLGIEDGYYSEPMSNFTQDDFRSNLNYLLEVIK